MNRPNFFVELLRSVALTLLTLVLVVLLGAGVFALVNNQGVDVEDDSWLVLDLYGSVLEYDGPSGALGHVMGGADLTLQDLLDNLGKAAVDDRIAGVILKVSSSNDAGWAKLEELRGAIDAVQAAGKPVHAWGDALDLQSLYLAAACDDVLMPAGGYMTFTGLATETMHVRGMLDKLGVTPHLHKIKDYKSATEMIMNTEMTDAAREMRTWMLEEIWDMVVPTLAADRGLDEARLVELMAYAEFEPVEAVESGLIDEVIYWQELEDRLKGEDDDYLRVIGHHAYAEVSWDDVGIEGGETVAVVHAQGNIGGRVNRTDPFFGLMMGHESIITELRRCRFDDDVKAVVFRVDSGGGESLASDLMAHEVDRLSRVKPVVVSMVDVAASGGYYIAYKGTKILADPLTVTGSIGSINGYFNARGFYDRIGVSKDFVTKGPMARLGTDYRDPTTAEWERHADAHWRSFNSWLADVADRRGMTFEHAETLAHGRVWTGRQALANGLIDGLGGLKEAIALAAELAELPEDEPPTVVHLPEPVGLMDEFFGDAPGDGSPVAAALRAVLYREAAAEFQRSAEFLQSGAANVTR